MKMSIFSVVKSLIFIICLAFIVFGQKTIGKPYLLMQLVGLAGWLGLLWDYNRKFV